MVVVKFCVMVVTRSPVTAIGIPRHLSWRANPPTRLEKTVIGVDPLTLENWSPEIMGTYLVVGWKVADPTMTEGLVLAVVPKSLVSHF